jgi:hypothetical protein
MGRQCGKTHINLLAVWVVSSAGTAGDTLLPETLCAGRCRASIPASHAHRVHHGDIPERHARCKADWVSVSTPGLR